MNGVRYLFDDKGDPQLVIIDLKKHRKLWEDFRDLLAVRERRNEARVPWEQLKSRLRKNGKLRERV